MAADSIDIRDPIHGFVRLNGLERAVIGLPPFQRLRRIRQLGLTEYVYPGATHSRFAHSLGVMHVASRLFDALWEREADLLAGVFGIADGRERYRQLVRLAALLHDLGHGPFSHVAEDMMPVRRGRTRWTHEDYSAAVARAHIRDTIDGHPLARSLGIVYDDVEALFARMPRDPFLRLLRSLIAGHADADRMDYLLRDSYYCGVEYGRFDLDRVVSTVALVEIDSDRFVIGATHDGRHAVEGLLIARYMMFSQVYFHKTRRIFDHHLVAAMREILGGTLPSPDTEEGVAAYLAIDDWHVLGRLAAGEGGAAGAAIRDRDHWRLVFETEETPTARDRDVIDFYRDLGDPELVIDEATRSWYSTEKDEYYVQFPNQQGSRKGGKLSELSSLAAKLPTTRRARVYAPAARRAELRRHADALPPAQGVLI